MIKKIIQQIPLLRKLAIIIYKYTLFNSTNYWERRYLEGGDSGRGSYGRLAKFKADKLNTIIDNFKITSICEFGCGDGENLKKYNIENYTGYDISEKIINDNKLKFSQFNFFNYNTEYESSLYDCTISFDVIYHLVSKEDYKLYMHRLFMSSKKYVLIYSSNFNSIDFENPHVRHREFVCDVPKKFTLVKKISNKYPYNKNNPGNTSLADFYLFKKTN
jgi:hypothetical protein